MLQIHIENGGATFCGLPITKEMGVWGWPGEFARLRANGNLPPDTCAACIDRAEAQLKRYLATAVDLFRRRQTAVIHALKEWESTAAAHSGYSPLARKNEKMAKAAVALIEATLMQDTVE